MNLKNGMNKGRDRRFLFGIIVFIGLSLLCVLIILIGPGLDAEVCTEKAARRINVNPNYSNLVTYVKNSLQAGMTENQVLGILDKLAPTKKASSQVLTGYKIRNTYIVKMCWFPYNNMVVDVSYDRDGNFLSVFIEQDSP